MPPGRGWACPVVGRSLRPSGPLLSRRCLRSAILAPLVTYAGSRSTPSPSSTQTNDARFDSGAVAVGVGSLVKGSPEPPRS